MGIKENEMDQNDIDSKLAALEEEPEVEVEVDPEQEEVEEVEEESAASEDDTDEEEPSESEGDEDEEEEDLDLSDSETGLIRAVQAEREKRQDSEKQLAEIKESLEKLQETVVSSKAPATLEEAYERDEKGVTDELNANIAQAVKDGDTLEELRLRDLKDNLKEASRRKKETQTKQQAKETEIATLLYSSIPDFDQKKAKELTEFATETLGFEMDDLNERTNIQKHGVEAVKEIVRINKAYKKSQVPKKAKGKKVKKATTVEKGGKGVKKTVVNAQKLIEKARKSGSQEDWMEVIEKRFG
jgi:hypothetical protein